MKKVGVFLLAVMFILGFVGASWAGDTFVTPRKKASWSVVSRIRQSHLALLMKKPVLLSATMSISAQRLPANSG